jgi:two-component sensor histidine kinase
MESLILEILPLERRPVLVRYAISGLFVLVAFLSRYVLATTMQGYPYLLFIPAVFASSLLFDRGSGFFATGLSALLAFYFFVPPAGSFWPIQPGDVLALILFVAISGAIAFVTEALRLALERVAAAERGKDLLLREVEHRVRNDLQGITSVLSLEQRKVASPEAREGLQRAAERVQVLSRVYGRLTRRESRATVDVRPFLEDLAADLRQVRIDGQPVSLEVRIEDATVTLDSAAALGLIANELVTNAVKHAFPDERPGRIELAFRRDGDAYLLVVADDGVGPTREGGGTGGLGHRLVRDLARQLGGELRIEVAGGTRATVRLPVSSVLPNGEASGAERG